MWKFKYEREAAIQILDHVDACTHGVRIPPHRVCKNFKQQFIVRAGLCCVHRPHTSIMADDTTSEEEIPGLCEHSSTDDSSDDENYVQPVRRKRKRKRRKRLSKRCKAKTKAKPKTSAKRKGRQPVARNTTYASKQKCLDLDAVREFIETGDCGCPDKCITKLKDLADEGAVDVVYSLRKQRFAGTYRAHITSIACDVVPPSLLASPHALSTPPGARCS